MDKEPVVVVILKTKVPMYWLVADLLFPFLYFNGTINVYDYISLPNPSISDKDKLNYFFLSFLLFVSVYDNFKVTGE